MARIVNRIRPAAYKYRFTEEARKLLPQHYLKRCEEFKTQEPTPVHWRPEEGKFKLNAHTGQREQIQNIPIEVIYPQECNKGLWGGEGIVYGYRKKKKMATRIPKIWRPYLTRRVLYSEILDKHFDIQVSMRTLDLIDEAYGFDHYILKTHEVDLNSQLGMKLKGEMLRALAKKSLYPSNMEKREMIYTKYEQYVIPEEEAEWVGLTVPEALTKARELFTAANPDIPLKQYFAQQLVRKLAEDKTEGEEKEEASSWTSKLNPFGSKTSDKS